MERASGCYVMYTQAGLSRESKSQVPRVRCSRSVYKDSCLCFECSVDSVDSENGDLYVICYLSDCIV